MNENICFLACLCLDCNDLFNWIYFFSDARGSLMIDRIISTVTETMSNNLWDTENRWSELYPPPNLHVCIV
jgi:hypothetical protein